MIDWRVVDPEAIWPSVRMNMFDRCCCAVPDLVTWPWPGTFVVWGYTTTEKSEKVRT
ncbi:MAG: hypothetical protein BWY66_00253 [bacterium ADurb.Bin374]|nr:MAG: hypothetical protein BWY66_00253 [bacterium ADurb.Bin374]